MGCLEPAGHGMYCIRDAVTIPITDITACVQPPLGIRDRNNHLLTAEVHMATTVFDCLTNLLVTFYSEKHMLHMSSPSEVCGTRFTCYNAPTHHVY